MQNVFSNTLFFVVNHFKYAFSEHFDFVIYTTWTNTTEGGLSNYRVSVPGKFDNFVHIIGFASPTDLFKLDFSDGRNVMS